MKRMLPPSEREARRHLAGAMASFGLGILLSFFLSPKLLILVEALLLVAAACLCLSDR
jgi:hypothetical protein